MAVTLKNFLKELAKDLEVCNDEAKKAQLAWLKENCEQREDGTLELDTVTIEWPDKSREWVVTYGLAEPNSFGIKSAKIKLTVGFYIKAGIAHLLGHVGLLKRGHKAEIELEFEREYGAELSHLICDETHNQFNPQLRKETKNGRRKY